MRTKESWSTTTWPAELAALARTLALKAMAYRIATEGH